MSWQGKEKPAPSDLSALLFVRRSVVERALLWLKRHNPLYATIEIDTAELESWEESFHGVPSQVYDRLERNEPSAREKTQTAHIDPPSERGVEDQGAPEIQEIMASLQKEQNALGDAAGDEPVLEEEGGERVTHNSDGLHEIGSSGMFSLDCRPDIAEPEKLLYLLGSMGEVTASEQTRSSAWVGSATVRHCRPSEPYIAGQDFADPLDIWFLAKTFPSLFPLGKGAPRQAEECAADAKSDGQRLMDSEVAARQLVASRNMSLEAWAKIMLQRHGGRFAAHPIFPFLVLISGCDQGTAV